MQQVLKNVYEVVARDFMAEQHMIMVVERWA